jgi:hypothetical protein
MDRIGARVADEPREWIEKWQISVVEDIVRRVSEGARRVNPKTIVSVAGFPGKPYLLAQGQDSVKWADEGLIDVVYDMQYEATLPSAHIRSVRARMKRPEALVVLCGNYETEALTGTVVPRSAGVVAGLLETSRTLTSGNGVGLYLYSMLSDDQVEALRHTVFRVPAVPSWSRAKVPSLPAPQNLRVQ